MAREESRLRRERVTVSEGDEDTHHCIAGLGLREGGQKTEAHPQIGPRDGDESIDLERQRVTVAVGRGDGTFSEREGPSWQTEDRSIPMPPRIALRARETPIE